MGTDNAYTKLYDLTGKIALATGASRGIGEEIAKALASLGAEVILVSRKLEGLQEVEKKITAAGGKAVSMPCNTGNMEEIAVLFGKVENKYGKLQILVNNSATNPFFGNNLDATDAAWEKTL